MVTTSPDLDRYLREVTGQMAAWVERGELQKVVLVVAAAATEEVLERWTFDVETDTTALSAGKCGMAGSGTAAWLRCACVVPGLLCRLAAARAHPLACRPPAAKSEKDIHKEIASIIRQITASITFLPLIDEPCADGHAFSPDP